MKATQVISVTLLCVLAANAQVLKPGKFPQPAVQQNFDPTRYMGKWYEIQKLINIFQRGECGTAEYHLKGLTVVGMLNSELIADGTINTGTAKVVDPSEPAKLEVSFFENSPTGPYWVLSSDYNHSLVYGCRDYGAFYSEYTWILYRVPVMPEETLEELHSILTSIGGSVDKLLTTNHDEVYCHPMFDKDFMSHFERRDRRAFSVERLLIYPTHSTGEPGYISDTETSTIWDADEL